MRFLPTPIGGALIVHIERLEDERGYFGRTSCEHEFGAQGIDAHWAQCSISYNRLRGTLRGMHYQVSPSLESKLVRCTRGAVYDVIVDARPGSPTEGHYFGINLTPDSTAMMYIPEGVAHGFITLADDTELSYSINTCYDSANQAGFRWDDPEIGIAWPLLPVCISVRDAGLPSFGRRRAP